MENTSAKDGGGGKQMHGCNKLRQHKSKLVVQLVEALVKSMLNQRSNPLHVLQFKLATVQINRFMWQNTIDQRNYGCPTKYTILIKQYIENDLRVTFSSALITK